MNKSYIGVGKVYVRPFGTTGLRRYVGNVSELALSHKLDTKKQKDYTRLGGGTAVKVERLEAVEASTTWLSFSSENLAIATGGTSANVAGATVSDEPATAYRGGLVRLLHPPLSIASVTNVGATLTYVAGTDYERSAAGLFIPATSAIVDAASILVDYTYGPYQRIEAAVTTATDLEVTFEGLNEADSGAPVVVDMWRMSFPSAEELKLIGDDFGELKFSSELIKDDTKGAGVSGFYRIQKSGAP